MKNKKVDKLLPKLAIILQSSMSAFALMPLWYEIATKNNVPDYAIAFALLISVFFIILKRPYGIVLSLITLATSIVATGLVTSIYALIDLDQTMGYSSIVLLFNMLTYLPATVFIAIPCCMKAQKIIEDF